MEEKKERCKPKIDEYWIGLKVGTGWLGATDAKSICVRSTREKQNLQTKSAEFRKMKSTEAWWNENINCPKCFWKSAGATAQVEATAISSGARIFTLQLQEAKLEPLEPTIPGGFTKGLQMKHKMKQQHKCIVLHSTIVCIRTVLHVKDNIANACPC